MKTKKGLGLFDAVMMGLGGAIGFEIFVLLDYAYFNLAGSGVVFALFLCGLINLLTMFSYCELCATIPEVGGEYTYAKAAFTGFPAFITGCVRWLSSVFGGALAAVCFAQQLSYFFSLFVPLVQYFVSVNAPLIAAIVVIVLGVLSVRGTKEVGTLIVGAFLVILAVFIVIGLRYGPMPPEVSLEFVPEGLSGVFAATAYTFTMFVGMRALVAGAPQIKNPGKNVSRAILLSTVVLTAVYCSVAYVVVKVVSVGDFVRSPLLNFAAEKIMGEVGGALLAIVGMIACLSSISTAIMVQSSIVRGMSRDGYLPKVLLCVHRRFETPYVAIIASSLFVMLFSIFGAVEFLGYAASFGSILVFAFVNLSVIKLRKRRPHLKRPFKAPLYPLSPITGILVSFVLLTSPMFLTKDENAVGALMSGLGLIALVLVTYYLRMVGYRRLRIAVGGASLGIGSSTALLTFLIETGLASPMLPSISSYVFIFVSTIFLLGGVLNVTAKTAEEEVEKKIKAFL